jgi:hypothetical protein
MSAIDELDINPRIYLFPSFKEETQQKGGNNG